MSIDIRLTGVLYSQIIRDLMRAHPFAAERVGFVVGRMGSRANEDKIILLNRYHSIPDNQYIDDASVGARIGSAALTWAMQAVYYGREGREGIFHVHIHDHAGEPRLSAVDRRDIPALIPGFQSVGREAPHGLIVLSRNHGTSWVWLPRATEPVRAERISVIGVPVRVYTPRRFVRRRKR